MTESSMQASRSLRFSTEHEAFSLSTRIWAIFIFKVVLYVQNSSQNCLHESQWLALSLICTPQIEYFICVSLIQLGSIFSRSDTESSNINVHPVIFLMWRLTHIQMVFNLSLLLNRKTSFRSTRREYSGKEYLITLPPRFPLLLQYCNNILWIWLFAVLNCLQHANNLNSVSHHWTLGMDW